MEVINIDKDSRIVINTQASDLELNINNCSVIITDVSNSNKKVNVNNASVEYCYVRKDSNNIENVFSVNNGKCSINVIDINNFDSDSKYLLETNEINDEIEFNVASIVKNKTTTNYLINTKNYNKDTKIKVDCFGIVQDISKLKYDITSYIKNGCKRSVVNQNSKILLFDKESVGINNPILEIEENDVKANHGSSIGMIDEETLFYLTSRGIEESVARNLVSMGKINYMIDKVNDEKIKKELLERV